MVATVIGLVVLLLIVTAVAVSGWYSAGNAAEARMMVIHSEKMREPGADPIHPRRARWYRS